MQPLLNDIADLILDALHRAVEPKVRQKGYVRFFSQPESINENEQTIRFRCSTNSVDRYSEIVDPDAFKKWLPVFDQNPIMMAGHVYVSPDGKPTSIGNWRDLRIPDDGLEATAWFMKNDDLAEPYW
jgi:hypothetical protein